jgi:hypothetical protein
MANFKETKGITDERFNELCFFLLVRRQIADGLVSMVPIEHRDMHDWRTMIAKNGADPAVVKMVISAIWQTVVRFSKLDLQFSPIDIDSEMVHRMCRQYLLQQKNKQPLLFGETATHEWWSIKEFLRQHECAFSETELAAARVKFAQHWLDAQVTYFTTNLTPAR